MNFNGGTARTSVRTLRETARVGGAAYLFIIIEPQTAGIFVDSWLIVPGEPQ